MASSLAELLAFQLSMRIDKSNEVFDLQSNGELHEHVKGFEKFGLSRNLLKGIFENGWEVPSPIQEASLEATLKGRDVLAPAKNGIDKTGAFCIPCLEKVDVNLPSIQALILVPTRELALQTAQICVQLGKHMEVKIMVTTGGTDLREDLLRLNGVVHVIIATPGRILDLMGKKAAKMDNCKMLILDEADKLLSDNQALDRIVDHLPKTHQTMLFSTTFLSIVADFALNKLKSPFEFGLDDPQTLDESKTIAGYWKQSRDNIECQLNDLRRHEVYKIWTEGGKSLYTGQQTTGGSRFYDHLNERGSFGKKLTAMLKDDKNVYMSTVFTNLTELEANNIENQLITYDKSDSSNDVCCNEVQGRFTKSFASLSPEERQQKINETFAQSEVVFKTLNPDQLISIDNLDAIKKNFERYSCKICLGQFEAEMWNGRCVNCLYAIKVGDCVRCPKTNIGVDENGRCRFCHVGQANADKKGVEYKDYNPSNNRQNSNLDNQPEKALAYSLYKLNKGQTDAASKITEIREKAFTQNNIKNWWKKFEKDDFDQAALKKLITVKKVDTLGEESIEALLKLEYSRSQSAEQAMTRINQLFGNNIVNLKLDVVQAKFNEFEDAKRNLKRKQQDEQDEQDASSAKKSKKE
ncbi:ATP-dependent RNA helicase cgh-1, protein [Aphelenchoides bicaudatus]|nr:ATP-dependent RNA helicase cgh-1, protein [Aphelenchoides bicaudatus]